MNSIHLSIVTHAEAARQQLPGTTDSDTEFDFKIPMRDGFENPARVFKPATLNQKMPTVVLIHGGGFAIGHPTHVGHYARGVANLFGTTVISITHRFTPDFVFPTPPNDIWDTLEWIFSPNSKTANLGDFNKTNFVLGGVSAGANLTAVTAQKWVSAKKSPSLAGIWLYVPWIMERELVPEKFADLFLSREQNTESLIIHAGTVKSILGAYKPDLASPDFSPLNDKNAHKELPPVYFQVCGQDPLRDDGLIYEKILKGNGVSTKIDVYPGVPHGFADVLPTFSLSQKFHADNMKGFGWLLGVEVSEADIGRALLPPA